jgi:ubiquitin-conjugating enzyme E2 J1
MFLSGVLQTDARRSRSRDWVCPHCKQTNAEMLPDPVADRDSHPPLLAGLASQNAPGAVTKVSTALRQPPEPSSAPAPVAEPDVTVHTVHPSLPPTRTPSTMSLDSLATREETTHLHAVHLASVPKVPVASNVRTHRPPLLLDTAICMLLVLTFALICKKVL